MKATELTESENKLMHNDLLRKCSEEKCIEIAETIALKTREKVDCEKDKRLLYDALEEMKRYTKDFLKGSYIGSMRVNRPYYRNQNK